MSVPHLYDASGQRITTSGGTLIPPARTFAALWGAYNNTYSYRRDEAIQDSPANALAMQQDVHLTALIQERCLPTINRKWQFITDEKDNPVNKAIVKRMTELTLKIPRFQRLKTYLAEGAIWYGNYGAQICWEQTNLGYTIGHPDPEMAHAPVNGDKIQWKWEGPPIIQVEGTWANAQLDNHLITTLDRGGRGYILSDPKDRARFIIHTHKVQDADYFQGQMAGMSRGLGLRSIFYWSNWIRTEIFQWMMGFMESVGMSDLMIFNYEKGNAVAQTDAIKNAQTVVGKMAIAVPRVPGNWNAVEIITANTAGITALMEIIKEYFDKGLERMAIGQSMTGGDGGDGDSMGGDGKAKLADDTKSHIIEYDTNNFDETLNHELFQKMLRYNFPWFQGRCTYTSISPDVQSAEKVDLAVKLVGLGIELKKDEVREAGGFTKPNEGDEVTEKQQPQAPGGFGGDPNAKPGEQQEQPDEKEEAHGQAVQSLLWGYGCPVLYRATYSPHTIKSGPRAGTSAYKNTVTGEIVDELPKGAAKTGGDPTASATATAKPPSGMDQAKATIEAMELTGPEKSHFWNAVNALGKAGPLVVSKAAQAAGFVMDVIQAGMHKWAELGITGEDILYSTDELSNPVKMMQFINPVGAGPVGGQWAWTSLLPSVAAFVTCKVKAMLRSKAKAEPEKYSYLYADDPGGVDPAMKEAVLAEAVGEIYTKIFEAMGWPIPPDLKTGIAKALEQSKNDSLMGQSVMNQYAFVESEHPRDKGKFAEKEGSSGEGEKPLHEMTLADHIAAAKRAHRSAVEKALADGLQVDPKTLAEYPDLAKKHAPPTPKREEPAESNPEAANKIFGVYDSIIRDKRSDAEVQSQVLELAKGLKSSDLMALAKRMNISVSMKRLPSDKWPKFIADEVTERRDRFHRSDYSANYEAAHAPAGGVTVGGKQFKGGEFIPGDVMAAATAEEKAAVEGKAPANPAPTPAKGKPKKGESKEGEGQIEGGEEKKPKGKPGSQLPPETAAKLKEFGVEGSLPPADVPLSDIKIADLSRGKEALEFEALMSWKQTTRSGRISSQYRYTKAFADRNAAEKHERVKEIKPYIKKIQGVLEQKMTDHSLPVRQREAAAIANAIRETGLRPTDSDESVAHGHFGISSIQARHAKVVGDEIHLDFIGKEGVRNKTILKDKANVEFIKEALQHSKGEDEFIFKEANSNNAGDTLKDAFESVGGSGDIKVKDLRTLKAHTIAQDAVDNYRGTPPPLTGDSKKDAKLISKAILEMATQVSNALNNKPEESRDTYVHPEIWKSWQQKLSTAS